MKIIQSMFKTFLLLLFLILLVSSKLKFINEKFKIMQFTDLHYGENIIKDTLSKKQQEILLDFEKPNLVVLSGDSVSGNPNKDFEESWKMLTEPMRVRKIPWAYTNGNHDIEGKLNGTQIIELDRKYGGLTQHGPNDITGASNYFLSIFSSDEKMVSANIFFFDSMRRGCYGQDGYGCVHLNVIQWYREKSKEIRERFGKIIPGISFLHIPTQEFIDVWNLKDCYGRKEENICCSHKNTGLFTAILEQKDIKSIWAGHDHKNDYHGILDGILLGYGRKTGYGGYSPNPSMQRGARVIELSENPFNQTTWIRQEDGTIGEMNLHKPDPNNIQIKCY